MHSSVQQPVASVDLRHGDLVKDDPPVRADGRCAECGKARVIPKTTYASREQYESDPFCSSKCCRRYHNVEPHRDLKPGGRGGAVRELAA